jgi:hypothetical protein
MKAINKVVVSEMVNVALALAEVKPFSIEDTTKALGRELCGYSLANDKVDALRLELKNFSDTKIERKKNIDKVLNELFLHDAKMLVGRGMSKCPIRNTLRDVLEHKDSGLKKATSDNYLSAISYSLRTKRPFDVHYTDTIKKENDAIEKSLNVQYTQKGLELSQSLGLDAVLSYFADCIIEVKALAIKNDTDGIDRDNLIAIHDRVQKEVYPIIASVIKQQKESATTPPATMPTATAKGDTVTMPTATAKAKGDTVTNKKSTRLDYCKDAVALVRLLFDATQVERYDANVSDADILYYNVILDSIDNIMDAIIELSKSKQGKDVARVVDDMDDMDDMDDNLGIDSELVD